MDTILETCNLGKRFGSLRAVDGLDLAVERGDVFGFLGPNGAGKSTTIRMMLGLVRPSCGCVRIFGCDVWHDRGRALSKVGALVESPAFYRYLTGRQNLWLLSELSGGASPEAIDAALERVGLSDRADDKVRSYSHGMRQRLGIAQALVCSPELVILDEPTNGLDPQGMKEVRELIRSLAAEHGMTVFLSSHLLYEVEQVCTKVAVIHRGRQLVSGTVVDLLSHQGRLRISVDRPQDAAAAVAGIDSVEVRRVEADAILIEAPNGFAAEVNRLLVTSGFDVSAIVPQTTTLEEFYFSQVGRGDDDTDQA
ncbi:MAG: ABC transporter ATP-binding protein [Armatimonadetes bacterium]|nr:ABC transporter ATP-binding protein [Armatimonadota bacterium]